MFTVTSTYVISCLHLLHNIFTNLLALWILLYKYFSSWESLRNYSTIFRSSHRRCIKLQGTRHVTLLKVEPNRDIFLPISGNLKEDLFWRTLVYGCIVGKCFVRTFFRLDLNLAKGTVDDVLWKVAKVSQDWIKMLPIIKYYVRILNY